MKMGGLLDRVRDFGKVSPCLGCMQAIARFIAARGMLVLLCLWVWCLANDELRKTETYMPIVRFVPTIARKCSLAGFVVLAVETLGRLGLWGVWARLLWVPRRREQHQQGQLPYREPASEAPTSEARQCLFCAVRNEGSVFNIFKLAIAASDARHK